KRIVETPLQRSVTIREENARAALEVMSRFAADPRWLIYLPPTMSPPATSAEPGLLEHPAEAFSSYRKEGVGQVVGPATHKGPRAEGCARRVGPGPRSDRGQGGRGRAAVGPSAGPAAHVRAVRRGIPPVLLERRRYR